MKKLSGLERSVLALTVLFFFLTAGWFLYEDRARDITRIQVSNPAMQVEAPIQDENPAPGILEDERININTASEADLTRLPGIGEVKAKSIVEYRTANGPFQTPEDLIKVSGIGEATLAGLLEYITVEDTGGTVEDIGGGAANAEDSGGG